MIKAEPISIVYVTAPTRDEALSLARLAVAERLAACANVLSGATSVYEWQGQNVEADEAVLVLKTPSRLVDELIARLVTLHSYDVPCVVAIPLQAGHLPFLEWIVGQTRGPG